MPTDGSSYDKAHLCDLVRRLSEQLHRCQHQLGVRSPTTLSELTALPRTGEGAADAVWLLDKDTTAPLLLAYDERIRELEGEARDAASRAADLERRVRAAADENLALHRELRERLGAAAGRAVDEGHTESSMDARAAGPSGGSGNSAVSTSLLLMASGADELHETLRHAQDESASLRQIEAAQAKKIELLSLELQQRDELLRRTREQAERLSLALRRATAAADQSAAAAAESEARVARAGDLAASLRSELDSALSQVAELRAVARAKETQVQDLEAAMQELSVQYARDADALTLQCHAYKDRTHELAAQCSQVESELVAAREQLAVEEQRAAEARQDAAGLLKVVSAHEQQLSEIDAREARARTMQREAAEKAEAAEIDCAAAQQQAAQAHREVARLLERLRTEASEHLSHEHASIDQMRDRFAAALKDRDDEIARLEDKVASLLIRSERAVRDKESAETLATATRHGMQSEIDRLAEIVRKALAQASSAEAARDAAVHDATTARRAADEAAEMVAADRARLLAELSAARSSLAEAEVELGRSRADLGAAVARCAELEGAAQRNVEDSRVELARAADALNECRATRARERRDAESRLESMRAELRGAADREQEAVEKGEREAARARAELRAAMAQLEATTTQLREENSRLRTRTEELSAHLAVLTSRNEDAEGTALATRELLSAARHAADDARREAEDRDAQMVALLSRAEDEARDASRLRADLENARASVAREVRLRQAADDRALSLSQAFDLLEHRLAEHGISVPPEAAVARARARAAPLTMTLSRSEAIAPPTLPRFVAAAASPERRTGGGARGPRASTSWAASEALVVSTENLQPRHHRELGDARQRTAASEPTAHKTAASPAAPIRATSYAGAGTLTSTLIGATVPMLSPPRGTASLSSTSSGMDRHDVSASRSSARAPSSVQPDRSPTPEQDTRERPRPDLDRDLVEDDDRRSGAAAGTEAGTADQDAEDDYGDGFEDEEEAIAHDEVDRNDNDYIRATGSADDEDEEDEEKEESSPLNGHASAIPTRPPPETDESVHRAPRGLPPHAGTVSPEAELMGTPYPEGDALTPASGLLGRARSADDLSSHQQPPAWGVARHRSADSDASAGDRPWGESVPATAATSSGFRVGSSASMGWHTSGPQADDDDDDGGVDAAIGGRGRGAAAFGDGPWNQRAGSGWQGQDQPDTPEDDDVAAVGRSTAAVAPAVGHTSAALATAVVSDVEEELLESVESVESSPGYVPSAAQPVVTRATSLGLLSSSARPATAAVAASQATSGGVGRYGSSDDDDDDDDEDEEDGGQAHPQPASRPAAATATTRPPVDDEDEIGFDDIEEDALEF